MAKNSEQIEAAKLRRQRRSTDELGVFPWHIGMVKDGLGIGVEPDKHPALTSAVFVVHGIGQQSLTETAAILRSGFEDTLTSMKRVKLKKDQYLPPPYIFEGYWANYADLKETFHQEWWSFDHESRSFFENLWRKRLFTVFGTVRWLFRQQLRLLSWRVWKEVGRWAWFTYLAAQIPLTMTWVVALFRYPRVVTGFLTDFRLYLDPKGVTEQAIAQNIDFRVRKRFMKMLGLDWDFRKLPKHELLDAAGHKVAFDRLVWVSHSLGTVISYNVLSDLLHRADKIESMPDTAEKRERMGGVRKFRAGLRRFVTMGSPLDKVAFLFPLRVTPWPDKHRADLFDCTGEGPCKEWWMNYFHVWDPVSGSLESPRICKKGAPMNFHIRFWRIPGWAHVKYWVDKKPLSIILSRTFGKKVLEGDTPEHATAWVHTARAFFGHLLFFLLLGLTVGIVMAIIYWEQVIEFLTRIGIIG